MRIRTQFAWSIPSLVVVLMVTAIRAGAQDNYLDAPIPMTAPPAPPVSPAKKAPAKRAPAFTPAPAPATEPLTQTNRVEVTADRLEYEADRKLLVGTGNVVVEQGPDVLRADFVTVDTRTEEAYATGNVIMEREGQIWTGDELTYNFRTRIGDFGDFQAFIDPLYVTAKESERVSQSVFQLRGLEWSSCQGDPPEFYTTATHGTVTDERYIRAWNVVPRLWSIPIFYLPYWKYDLERRSNWDFLAGYSSRWGAYLLTAYNFRINRYFYSTTHFDYRTDRGFGIGQDIKWNNWAETNGVKGILQTYYTHDNKPFRDDEDEQQYGNLIDSDRYRISLLHGNTFSDEDPTFFTDRDYLIADINYLSDPKVLEDFFPKEYEDEVQPENQISLVRRGDYYTAGILVNKRLNDFYQNVDRLPEATLDFRRQRIGESPFYYQGNNSATYLKKVYPDGSTSEDYEAGRVDSKHMIYYPTRHWAFLNVIPRAGYDGTYYSKTKELQTITETVAVTTTNVSGGVTNIVSGTTNKTSTITVDGSGKLRNLAEFGVESSFKAFKVFIPATRKGGGLRHIFEPYIDYTYIPNPNVTPDDLYQFDEIDELDGANKIRLGMRNKLQTKKRTWTMVQDPLGVEAGSMLPEDLSLQKWVLPIEPVVFDESSYVPVRDLVNLDVYTEYRFEHEKEEEDFSELFYRGDLRPAGWLRFKVDGRWDWYKSEFERANTRMELVLPDVRTSVEHRYWRDNRNQIASGIVLFPNYPWSVGSSWRFSFDDDIMEEQSYFVARKTGCLGMSLGYIGRGDDWDWVFQIWLMAFPKSYAQSEVSY